MRRIKKRFIIIFILILLLGLSTSLYFKKYHEKHSQNAIIVKLANISVNYLDGNVYKSSSKEKKVSFSIINDSKEDAYFSIKLINVKKVSKDTVVLLNDKTKIKLKKTNELVISKGIKISPEDNQSFSLTISNPSGDVNAFEIEVIEEKDEEPNITKSIISNSSIKSSSATKVGEEIAVNDEGLISDLDDLGITYYFRGNVSNNYFSFADKMWRIVRINGDNSVRLILNDKIDTPILFAEKSSSFNETNIYKALNDWYESNLSSVKDYLTENKYCYDAQLTNDNRLYASYNRIIVAKLPSFNCNGDLISLKVGLLSLDEAIYAGLMVNTENKTNYLYNESIADWWLMTPALTENETFYPFIIKNDGSINYSVSSKDTKAMRPVINIASNYSITGNGTEDNPYMIKK